MYECSNCHFFGLIHDECDQLRRGCTNVYSVHYLEWVCLDSICSRYVPSAEVCKSCDTCVHSTCNTQSDKDACLSCFGSITNYSNYVSVARAVTEKCVSTLVSGDPF